VANLDESASEADESFDLDDEDADDSASSRDLAEADDDNDRDSEEVDDLEDAAADDIDFVIAAYREDGQSIVTALADELANDLEELIVQLRRLPGDGGAIGLLSLVGEVAVVVRVRGRRVQLLLSDSGAANDWPIARDIAEYLSEEVPDADEDETEPMGDLALLSDVGMDEFDLAALCDDLDISSDELLANVADKIRIGPQFRKIVDAALAD
jgi:putative tRNA adenosine deaminase-associated protein